MLCWKYAVQFPVRALFFSSAFFCKVGAFFASLGAAVTCILSCHWSLCAYLPFSGERLNPPPQMFIRGGGVWVGCLVLGGWVPQNPKTPQPLINIPWSPSQEPRCGGVQERGSNAPPPPPQANFPPPLVPTRDAGAHVLGVRGVGGGAGVSQIVGEPWVCLSWISSPFVLPLCCSAEYMVGG